MRLDRYLVSRGDFESRHQAQIAIKDGVVKVNGKTMVKPATPVLKTDDITLDQGRNPYISQGGRKLAHALAAFNVSLTGLTLIDIGASTGGFTDCALQAGVKKVYAVDVGTKQMHPRLRSDSRVILKENTNFLDTDVTDFSDVNFAVMDVSFTSSKPLLKHLLTLIENVPIIVLVKPQFESRKTPKSGVVRDKKMHQRILNDYLEYLAALDLAVSGLTASPIKGQSGNIEFLLYLNQKPTTIDINRVVEDAHKD